MLERVLWPRGRRTVTARAGRAAAFDAGGQDHRTALGRSLPSAATRSSRSSRSELGAALSRRAASSTTARSAPPTAARSSECSPSCRRALQGARGRRGHLRDGLLRELHARRVAGQRGGEAGRRPDGHRSRAKASSARPATTATGLGHAEPAGRASCPGHVDVQTVGRAARQRRSASRSKAVDPQALTARAGERREPCEPDAARHRLRGHASTRSTASSTRTSWSDGLPIVPPTARARRASSCASPTATPDEAAGRPAARSAAAPRCGAIAVNGVMAGCRPEYMPVLVALVEAMADPRYGVEHSGNTPGAETLIIVNGLIIRRLGFNYQQGAARRLPGQHDGIGPLRRLYLRNVAGFLPHKTDKGTLRQHLARGAGGERGRAVPHGLDDDRSGSGATGRRQRGHDLALHRRHRAGLGLRHAAGADDPVPGRRHRADRRLGGHLHRGDGRSAPSGRC